MKNKTNYTHKNHVHKFKEDVLFLIQAQFRKSMSILYNLTLDTKYELENWYHIFFLLSTSLVARIFVMLLDKPTVTRANNCKKRIELQNNFFVIASLYVCSKGQ